LAQLGEDKLGSREARKESRSLGIFKGVSKTSDSPTTSPPPSTSLPNNNDDASNQLALPPDATKPVEKTTKTTATYYPKLSRQDSLIATTSRKETAITTSTATGDETPAQPTRKETITPASALAKLSGGYESESGDELGPDWNSPQSVALKPYSHQVGGHSALFRFSRHAVCKPLIEKENAFYQDIEINRPECTSSSPLCMCAVLMVVLPFMPRYIGTLNVTHRDYPSSSSGDLTPPSPRSQTPATKSPKNQSPDITPSSTTHTPTRTITPLPEVQIDKNRHVTPHSIPKLTVDYSEMVIGK
jgi:hypothetical protein